MRKLILLLLLVCAVNPICAEPQKNRGYVGTPPGFYDDIDPGMIDADDDNQALKLYRNSSGIQAPNYENMYQNYSGADSSQPTKDYADIYNSLQVADFSYLHNIDPDQYYDTEKSAWSIYPLLRLNSPIYFKNIAIEPGYYLLTPREHNGKWYLLFKQNGIVMHIIPVYERDYTPKTFYDEHIPKPKLTNSQKIHMKILDAVGKVKSSKREEPIKSYLEVNDLDNYFLSIIVYYGGHKYSTLFRTIRL